MGTAVKTAKKKRGAGIPAALKQYAAIWLDGKIDLVDKVFDPRIVRHHPPSIRPPQVTGIEGYKAYVVEFRTLHPELNFEILDLVKNDRSMAYRFIASAFNPPNNQRFTFEGMTLVRLSRGKIVEEFVTWDTYDLLVQVGVVPPREP